MKMGEIILLEQAWIDAQDVAGTALAEYQSAVSQFMQEQEQITNGRDKALRQLVRIQKAISMDDEDEDEQSGLHGVVGHHAVRGPMSLDDKEEEYPRQYEDNGERHDVQNMTQTVQAFSETEMQADLSGREDLRPRQNEGFGSISG